MKLIDIKCLECGSLSEVLLRGDEKPSCPHCKSLKVERKWSNPPLPIFKGSGFYETDYKGKP